MRILLKPLPEPSDQVIQNLTIGEFPLGPVFEPWQDLGSSWYGENVLQGEWGTSKIPEIPVPSALVGWNPYFAQPKEIGPVGYAGGVQKMVPIGPASPVNRLIDPQLIWLSQNLPLNEIGELAMSWQLPSLPAPEFDIVLSNNAVLATPVNNPLNVPRQEIVNSRGTNQVPVANMPADFGLVNYPTQISYQVFTIVGQTLTGAGLPEGNVRVILYQSGWRYVQSGEKIIAETISDGSGNFSILARNIDYQMVGYKEGAPDLAGVTRQDVVPTALITNIYMRNPTTSSPAGGGGETSYTFIG